LLVKVYFASKGRAAELKTCNSFLRICTDLPANSRGGMEKLKFPGPFVVRYHIRPIIFTGQLTLASDIYNVNGHNLRFP
jgi:hypothetical protein